VALAGAKTVVLSHLYMKTIILPRQARDKHRESTQKRRSRVAPGLPKTSASFSSSERVQPGANVSLHKNHLSFSQLFRMLVPSLSW
jgi:hypothetical protein